MLAVQHLPARALRPGDTIHLGGAPARVIGVRHAGALVVVGLQELGAWATFDGDQELEVLARSASASAASAQRHAA